MQPYVNPNYFNQNPYQNNFNQPMQIPMPMQNPYMDRMNQLQNYQQSLQMPQQQFPTQQNQPQWIIGRVVNDFSEITANDVPMNGNAAFFPKADGSELQVRSWTANGTIQTVVYKPILEQKQTEGTNIPQNDFTALNDGINAFREEILARLDSIEKSVAKPTTNRAKKGDSDNE